MKCSICGKKIIKPVDSISTGYGTDGKGRIICFGCCADIDKAEMIKTGRAVLYLSGNEVTNWPGTLKITVRHRRKGRHNIAGTRTDVWFVFGGQHWHGVQYGNFSQLCYCKRLKAGEL